MDIGCRRCALYLRCGFRRKFVYFLLALKILLSVFFFNLIKINFTPKIAKPPHPVSNVSKFDSGLAFQCSTGELGNRMIFYAVTYGLSRLNNRSGYVQLCNTNTCRWSDVNCSLTSLDQTFDLSLPVGPNLPQENQRRHSISFHLNFPSDYHIPPEANVLVGEPYPCSVTHFLHVREEIRREFRFKKTYVDHAINILNKIMSSRANSTLIGVHVRRGSYLSHLNTFRKPAAPPEFFMFGLKYFRQRFVNPVFIVLSDDLSWCKTNIVGDDVVIQEAMSTAAHDLALLSHCQHTIFDYGTYGLWAAFLAGGEALYFVDGITDPSNPNSLTAAKMYPPEWLGITKNMLQMVTIN